MKTIVHLFEECVANYGDNPFLWEKKTDKFEPTTYRQTSQQVQRMAAGLLNIGVQKGDKIALLSEGRNAWIIGELAILYSGAVNVPLSVKLEGRNDLIFRLQHSESKFIMVSGGQLPKIRNIASELPMIKKVIILDEQPEYRENEIFVEKVCQMGDLLLSEKPDFVKQVAARITGSDYANISYTSGTTADPKGILLTHRNYTANVEQALSLISIPPYFKTLIILPLDHCFAHVAGFYSFMACGASVATVKTGKTPIETLKNIPLNIREVQPHILLSVPSLAKNFRKNIEAGVKAKGRLMWQLFNVAMRLSYSYNREGYNRGGWQKWWMRPLLALFDKLLFSKIRQVFGGQLQYFIGGGALLDIQMQRFYYALGVPMFQGYGLSEATPVISSNALRRHKLGSSGFLVQPMELKICDADGNELPTGEKGEIVIRGENVMAGYWKNSGATAETVRDGWLYTGDMGYMDTDGFLYVTGRFKSLLISNDGEKYSPEGIEEEIATNSSYIDQVMLHNNQDPYTVALVVPNREALKTCVKTHKLEWNSPEGRQKALEQLQQEVDQYKKGGIYANKFPDRWLPVAIAVLPEAFTEQNQLMNSTMKIVRGKITERYADRIRLLYTPEGKDIINEENMKVLL
ncbi:MAG: AMP-binding protein [Bacteroidales bacterium]|jgi:long-chain acyl-CoA synthetase|nr:AMP-binding protein [Bacteroidales bacterium]